MTSKADQFREHAAKCEQRAKDAHSPQAKKDFAECARQWRLLAEQADRLAK